MSNPARAIAIRHFGAQAVSVLANRGIRLIGLQALPGPDGSCVNSETGYVVDDQGTGRVWSYAQMLEAAR